MFVDQAEQELYILENYLEVTDRRVNAAHWDLDCEVCGVTRGFEVVKARRFSDEDHYDGPSFLHPKSIVFHCPVCDLFKLWVVFEVRIDEPIEGTTNTRRVVHIYKVTALPSEGLEEIAQLPEDPPALRVAYRQAVRAMDANAHMAAAAMFRRALQVITRDILGATPSTLARELQLLVGTEYNGTKLTDDFATNGYIIKESGNQGAHPDEDPDLLNFTQQDAEDLQRVFMELVSDLFIVPEAIKKAKADFLQRRKITPPAGQ